MDWWNSPILLAVIGLGGGGIGAAITAFIPKKGSVEHQMIDQLQELLETAATREKEILARESRQRVREMILEDYVDGLRAQINNNEGPPPKPWPKELTRGSSDGTP